jgi:hypothetical protein
VEGKERERGRMVSVSVRVVLKRRGKCLGKEKQVGPGERGCAERADVGL